MNRYTLHYQWGFVLLGIVAGCSAGDTGSVEGRVLINGEPQGGYEVNFTSVGDGSSAMGSAMSDGHYRLSRGRGKSEIPVGQYKVTLVPSALIDNVPMPKSKLSDEYTKFENAILVKEIKGGSNVIDLEVAVEK